MSRTECVWLRHYVDGKTTPFGLRIDLEEELPWYGLDQFATDEERELAKQKYQENIDVSAYLSCEQHGLGDEAPTIRLETLDCSDVSKELGGEYPDNITPHSVNDPQWAVDFVDSG